MTTTDLRKKVEAKTGKKWKRTTYKNAKDYYMTHMKICPKDDDDNTPSPFAFNLDPPRDYTNDPVTVDDP